MDPNGAGWARNAAELIGGEGSHLDQHGRNVEATLAFMVWSVRIALEDESLRPIPPARKVRQWLRKLGATLTALKSLETQSTEMARFFDYHKFKYSNDLWQTYYSQKSDGSESILAGSQIRHLNSILELEFAIVDIENDWKNAVGLGGRVINPESAKRMAAGFGETIFVLHGSGSLT